MKPARASTILLLTLFAASFQPVTSARASHGFIVPGAVRPMWAGYQSADAPAKESRTPSVVIGSKEERVAKAAANYAQNRSVEAALGFEGLWKDYPAEHDFLFNAAASRFAAGHFAHAIAYTRDYLLAAREIAAEDRKEAEAQLREALAQTSAVGVTVNIDGLAPGGGPAGVTIVAQHVARESGDLRPELLFAARLGVASTLQLDLGYWTVRAEAAGYTVAEQRVEVRKGQVGAVTLRLAPAPVKPPEVVGPAQPREVPAKVVRANKIGFGVTGGVFSAVGIGVMIAGGVKAGSTKDCTIVDVDVCGRDLSHGLTTRAAGTIVLGGGLGLITGGLTWLAKDPAVRKKAWIAEAVVGGVAVVVGLVVSGMADTRFTEANNGNTIKVWSDHYEQFGKLPGHAIGNTLLGFGGGAVVSSVVGLLVQRKYLHRGIGVSAMLGRGQAGLALYGRF